MQVHNAADFGLVALGSHQVVIDGEQMALGQLIGPLHQYAFAAAHLDHRSGRDAVESPQARRFQVAMHAGFRLPHHHAVEGKLLGRICRIGPNPVGRAISRMGSGSANRFSLSASSVTASDAIRLTAVR